MQLELDGQIVVIGGGTRGIGQAIAAELITEGADVTLLDRDPETVAVARHMGAAHGMIVDVTDYAAVQDAAHRVRERFGHCDHIVQAAAIGSGKFGMPFWNLAPADWAQVLQVNVMGAVHIAHAFGPGMAERKWGSILFIGSVAGQIGSPSDPPYSASKAALINFAQCAARDLAPFGVRVNTVNPGMVRTALNRAVWESWNALQPADKKRSFEEWAAEKIERLVPLNRWQEVEDIAAMAVFLASSRGQNITGQTINVDGGYVMHW
jgi:2-hydroxycyclohexanecarboxyl-CoA dehydrogenase